MPALALIVGDKEEVGCALHIFKVGAVLLAIETHDEPSRYVAPEPGDRVDAPALCRFVYRRRIDEGGFAYDHMDRHITVPFREIDSKVFKRAADPQRA